MIMNIEILEEKIKKIEDEFEKIKKEESYKIEKIKNEIKLININLNELNTEKIRRYIERNNKLLEKKTKEKNSYSKKKKYVKGVKKEIYSELKLLKNEKKKINFISKKNNFAQIHKIENEIKQNFSELNVKRQFLFQSIFEKLAKYKNESLYFFKKHLNMQKQINILFQLINNNALNDIFILYKNGLLFQNELVNIFQTFYYQIKSSLKE